jgi:sulfate adenylyltransferase subunit 1
MDLFRFSVAGSVDNGQKTLIGRLLYDSKNTCEYQLDLLQKQSKNKNVDGIDLVLLKAEREQGIAIDVAHRCFSTFNRKFMIADFLVKY